MCANETPGDHFSDLQRRNDVGSGHRKRTPHFPIVSKACSREARSQPADGGTQALLTSPLSASTNSTLDEQLDSLSGERCALHSSLSAHVRKQ